MQLAPHLHRIGNDIVAAYLVETPEGITVIDAAPARALARSTAGARGDGQVDRRHQRRRAHPRRQRPPGVRRAASQRPRRPRLRAPRGRGSRERGRQAQGRDGTVAARGHGRILHLRAEQGRDADALRIGGRRGRRRRRASPARRAGRDRHARPLPRQHRDPCARRRCGVRRRRAHHAARAHGSRRGCSPLRSRTSLPSRWIPSTGWRPWMPHGCCQVMARRGRAGRRMSRPPCGERTSAADRRRSRRGRRPRGTA